MSLAEAFLGGFLTGGLTTFLVTAVTVWKPRLEDLRSDLRTERDLRAAAEDDLANGEVRLVIEDRSDHPTLWEETHE